MTESEKPAGPLAGIRVLDLSRILAGPWCSQILGDLGAEVIKIEQPGHGDDSRKWGPPFLEDGSGDSAYYLCANRNKRSVAIDIARPEGAELVRKLAADSDIVLENFRAGGLEKYGLDYESLRKTNPALIYGSITGFGQYGPYKDKGGYDFLIQGMSGLMSVTGRPEGEPGAGPLKAGVSIADLTTGLYLAIGVLAALHHRDVTGQGQRIDNALLDTLVALTANQSAGWLNGGLVPRAMGNAHPTVLPYQDFACSDGQVLVALGNDRQFHQFCRLLGLDEMAEDPGLATNAGRIARRDEMIGALASAIAEWRSDDLIAAMEAAKLPGGKVNTIPQVLEDPQIAARGLVREMTRSDGTEVRVLGFPPQLSETPATYRHAPPRSGEDTRAVLAGRLGLAESEIDVLLAAGVIAESL
ncbi:CaiB/BaiF CoA-transferase family protein [Novosphingobium sp. ZN18A2]|uniref:CaiB/BaiF CoA transferase family protein n=1 Tax=Novosphingobium sp. ZN18A2 TaxID=3079861 RepID=UPI0030CF7E55